MRSLFLPSAFLSFGLAAIAIPTLSPWVTHEQRSDVPEGWSVAHKPDDSTVLPLRFALTQSNIENLEEYLYDVSHPESPNYGKHWSAHKIATTFAPTPETVDAVRDWLIESGIDPQRIRHTSSKGWLEVKATIKEAEDLLRTSYNVYEHETGAKHIACESYQLPQHLTSHVDLVLPTVHFDARLSKSKRSEDAPMSKSVGEPSYGNGPKISGTVLDITQPAGCETQITPDCLRRLYNFDYIPLVPWSNSYGIPEFTPQLYNQGDLDTFAQRYSPDLDGISPGFVSIDGGDLSLQPGQQVTTESNLDLEYAMTLVGVTQPVTLYQVGDPVKGGTFNTFLDALDGEYCSYEGGDDPKLDPAYPDTAANGYNGHDCGIVQPANVISVSYGQNEAALTYAYANRQCNEYGKLGLMGVTFLFSSGDDGVAGNGNRCLNNGNTFNPTFPSTCPYVTSVGATQLSTPNGPEVACEETIRSGGGFSNYFDMPDYQRTAVTSYLQNTPPPYAANVWNSNGKSRGYPDLSANGANYAIADGGAWVLVSGTSASAPVVGAILTMINDARIFAGKSTIGFINPTIYLGGFASLFNDITSGTNPGCGTPGYSTAPGWDPVTGLGTPNFELLRQQWLTLP